MHGAFRGESVHRLDAKGRVSIPASFRRVLEEGDPDWRDGLPPRLTLVYGDPEARFLECYTVAEMTALERRIEAMPRFSPSRRAAVRTFVTQSAPLEVDPTGRIVLPQEVRARFDLGEELVFEGNLRTFRIWRPDRYEAMVAALDAAYVEGDPASDPYAAVDGVDPGGAP